MTSRLQDRADRVRVESATACLRDDPVSGLLRRAGLAMGPRLGQRVVAVRGREKAGRKGDRGRRAAAVVPGPVQSLVVKSSRRRQGVQEGRAAEDPLGVVGVQPDPFPVVLRQSAVNVPHPCRHGDASEVVDERGPPEGTSLTLVETAELAGTFCQPRDPARVPQQERRHQVGEVPHGTEGFVDRAVVEQSLRSRLGLQDRRPERVLAGPGPGSLASVSRGARRRSDRKHARHGSGSRGRRSRGRRACTGTRRHARRARCAWAGEWHRLEVDEERPFPSQRSSTCANIGASSAGSASRPNSILCHVAVRRHDLWERSEPVAAPRVPVSRRAPRRFAGGANARAKPATMRRGVSKRKGAAYVVNALSAPKTRAAVSAVPVQPMGKSKEM